MEIAQNADLVVVVLAPGQGDSVQMLKAGLLEAADLFVVNKSDWEWRRSTPPAVAFDAPAAAVGATRLGKYAGEPMTCSGVPMLTGPQGTVESRATPAVRTVARQETPPVFRCSAIQHEGVAELTMELKRWTDRHAVDWQNRRRGQTIEEIRLAVLEEVRRRISDRLAPGRKGTRELESALQRVIDRWRR